MMERQCSFCSEPRTSFVGPEKKPWASFCPEHGAKFTKANQRDRGLMIKRAMSAPVPQKKRLKPLASTASALRWSRDHDVVVEYFFGWKAMATQQRSASGRTLLEAVNKLRSQL